MINNKTLQVDFTQENEINNPFKQNILKYNLQKYFWKKQQIVKYTKKSVKKILSNYFQNIEMHWFLFMELQIQEKLIEWMEI